MLIASRFCFSRSLMGSRPSRKTERHWFAHSRACFKETSLKTPTTLISQAAPMNGITVNLLSPHFYADGVTSRYYHTLVPAFECCRQTLALKTVHEKPFVVLSYTNFIHTFIPLLTCKGMILIDAT